MAIRKKYSIAIVDIEKIDEVNQVLNRYATAIKQYSTYFYFNLSPLYVDDVKMDITFFQVESENESSLNKELNDLVEALNQLNTEYAIRDEGSHEMIVELEHMTTLIIKFDNVKFLKKGVYEKIDSFNHLKTEFGICKNYYPNFRPIENTSIENIDVEPESIYLFSNSSENLSKLKAFVLEKVMEIDSDFEIEFEPFKFID